jgi:hypothetical protein
MRHGDDGLCGARRMGIFMGLPDLLGFGQPRSFRRVNCSHLGFHQTAAVITYSSCCYCWLIPGACGLTGGHKWEPSTSPVR